MDSRFYGADRRIYVKGFGPFCSEPAWIFLRRPVLGVLARQQLMGAALQACEQGN